MSSHAEGWFGSGLREQIQRRHPAATRRARLVAVDDQTGDVSRRAEDVLAGDWFSAPGSDRASAEEKSREDKAAEPHARLEQVGGDLATAEAELASRAARITELEVALDQLPSAHEAHVEMLVRLNSSVGDGQRLAAELADREERLTDLQLPLEASYRQRDDTNELVSLETDAVNQRPRLMTARKQIVIAAAASFAVALAVGRVTR